jgi:hypothetical protein
VLASLLPIGLLPAEGSAMSKAEAPQDLAIKTTKISTKDEVS